MAFRLFKLNCLAYANGFTLWHYRSSDSLADLIDKAHDYFGPAGNMLQVGDRIMVSFTDTPVITAADLVVTRSGVGGAVGVERLGT